MIWKNISLDSYTIHVTVKGVIKMEMPYYASKCFVWQIKNMVANGANSVLYNTFPDIN